MKKTILTTAFAFTVLFASAQLKVFTNGKVSAGSTTAPNQSLDVTGDISLVSATGSFRINNNIILGHKGITTGIFIGIGAGISTTGANNTFIGNNAGYTNTTGIANTANGITALYSNISGNYNTANGRQSMYSNTTGVNNAAHGTNTLFYNSAGSYNAASGVNALFYNTTGNYNCGNGNQALYNNTTGYNNTGLGASAGLTNPRDTACTFVGYGADASGNYYNSTAIGYGAVATARNKMYMGNTLVIGVYSTTGVFTTSDGRFKTNVNENVKGLAFINKLRPVTYNMNTKSLDDFMIQNMPDSIKSNHQAGMDFESSTAKIHSGFIAQEVEMVSQQFGSPSSIVSTPSNSSDPYGLNYAEFVVPLVKAVQELSKMKDSLTTVTTKQDSTSNAQNSKIDVLQNQVNQLLTTITNCCAINDGRSMQSPTNYSSQMLTKQTNVVLTDAQTIVLEQNVPNPFAEQTSINYSLPDNTVKAQMLFYNSQGKLIQSTELTQKGKATLTVFASDLSSGIYTYTLVVDGKIIETKKMVKQ